MNTPESPDSVSGTLAGWRVEPLRDPQFRSGVWARIEAARHAPPWPTFARAHAAMLAGVLVVSVLAGALTGREKARTRLAIDRARLADSYVESMDARLMRMP